MPKAEQLPPNCAVCLQKLVKGIDFVCPPGCEALIDMLYVRESNEARGISTPSAARVRDVTANGPDSARAGVAKIASEADEITAGKETFCSKV